MEGNPGLCAPTGPGAVVTLALSFPRSQKGCRHTLDVGVTAPKGTRVLEHVAGRILPGLVRALRGAGLGAGAGCSGGSGERPVRRRRGRPRVVHGERGDPSRGAVGCELSHKEQGDGFHHEWL